MEFLSKGIIESIIRGIIVGYKDYINVRNEVNKKMYISEAYAFVRSNHIEDQVAKHVNNEVDFAKKNAGPSWKYLEFGYNYKRDSESITFILQNEDYFNENNVTYGRNLVNNGNNKEKQYMKPLVEKNKDINFSELEDDIKKEHQLTAESILFKENNNRSNKNIVSYFHIITYKIDKESRQLESIKLWLPNPDTNQAIMIEDLTHQLFDIIKENEEYFIEDEYLEVLRNSDDQELNLVNAENIFGFILEKEKDFVEDER